MLPKYIASTQELSVMPEGFHDTLSPSKTNFSFLSSFGTDVCEGNALDLCLKESQFEFPPTGRLD